MHRTDAAAHDLYGCYLADMRARSKEMAGITGCIWSENQTSSTKVQCKGSGLPGLASHPHWITQVTTTICSHQCKGHTVACALHIRFAAIMKFVVV